MTDPEPTRMLPHRMAHHRAHHLAIVEHYLAQLRRQAGWQARSNGLPQALGPAAEAGGRKTPTLQAVSTNGSDPHRLDHLVYAAGGDREVLSAAALWATLRRWAHVAG